ncbi:hypothetical protein ZHAS_00008688 [Anopheles sinensis]|uniref:Uncharacterized protein n=1 Tax=Anopheles sinensis TaxID=74873 RepID=A0A084VT47_ANOSI|nr:hypothetical protein ZHAS_00008688 [Anopheles sinensis]
MADTKTTCFHHDSQPRFRVCRLIHRRSFELARFPNFPSGPAGSCLGRVLACAAICCINLQLHRAPANCQLDGNRAAEPRVGVISSIINHRSRWAPGGEGRTVGRPSHTPSSSFFQSNRMQLVGETNETASWHAANGWRLSESFPKSTRETQPDRDVLDNLA